MTDRPVVVTAELGNVGAATTSALLALGYQVRATDCNPAAYRLDIVKDYRLYVPTEDGRVAFIDVADLGAVAAAIFANTEMHRSEGYTLTGPAALTFAEVAELLTSALGQPVRYQPASTIGYLQHPRRRRRRMPMAQVAMQTILHLAASGPATLPRSTPPPNVYSAGPPHHSVTSSCDTVSCGPRPEHA